MLTLGNNLSSRLTIIFGWCAFLWSYEVLQLLNRSYKQGPILYYIFNTLLISLFVLHIYWWVLIFRMIVKQVEARGRISDDVRSDSDDDDDDDEGTGKEDWYQQNLQVNAAFSAMALHIQFHKIILYLFKKWMEFRWLDPTFWAGLRPIQPHFLPTSFLIKVRLFWAVLHWKRQMLVCWASSVQ